MLVCPNCKGTKFNIKLVKNAVVELAQNGEDTVMNPISMDETETSVFESCASCGQAISPDGGNLMTLTSCSFCGEAEPLNEDGICAACVAKKDELLGLDTMDLVKRLIQLEKQCGVRTTTAEVDIDLVPQDEVI